MSVVTVPLARLKLGALGENPNKMDQQRYDLLVANLRAQRDGAIGGNAPDIELLQPVLVRVPGADGLYEVIDGEHRSRAALDAGWADVSVRVVDCTPEQARALRLGLNQIRGELDLSIASKDIDLLAKAGWSPDDMALTGFAPDEITTLLDVSQDVDGDFAQGAAANVAQEELDDREEKTSWTLEIHFADKKTYQRAKRKLKKLAGKGNELSAGLMKALVED